MEKVLLLQCQTMTINAIITIKTQGKMIKKNKIYRIELTFSNPYIGSRKGGNKVECDNLTYAEASHWLLFKIQ